MEGTLGPTWRPGLKLANLPMQTSRYNSALKRGREGSWALFVQIGTLVIQLHSYCGWEGSGYRVGHVKNVQSRCNLIGPVISELCVAVCIISSVKQSIKRCIYLDSATRLLLFFSLFFFSSFNCCIYLFLSKHLNKIVFSKARFVTLKNMLARTDKIDN